MVTLAIGIVHCLEKDLNELAGSDEIELFEYFDSLRSLEFCEKKIKVRKVLTYANSISNAEIKEALTECKTKNNIYYVYLSREQERKEIWYNIIDKLARERKMFKEDHNSVRYKRNQDAVNHLEKFFREKVKHYNSKKKQNYRKLTKTSNFSINLED